MVREGGLYRHTNAKRCLKSPRGRWGGDPSHFPDPIPPSVVWGECYLSWEAREVPQIRVKEKAC